MVLEAITATKHDDADDDSRTEALASDASDASLSGESFASARIESIPCIEILPNRFFWQRVDKLPLDTEDAHYFTVDDYHYDAFAHDFGPFNLSVVVKYCKLIEAKLADPSLAGRRIVHCCGPCPHQQANTACLACLYLVVVHQLTASSAFAPFSAQTFTPFRDATLNPVCLYGLSILDCLAGVETAMQLKWFDYQTFNAEVYDFLDEVDGSGINWIIPGKFVAFAGPSNAGMDQEGMSPCTPDDYVPLFKRMGVQQIIRLNSKEYDASRFTRNGFGHADLIFRDGTTPPDRIVTDFLKICESVHGVVAVHCKAGLGRTCTLMGLYAMKHFHFPARAFIGWCRICRPGSILGPQQPYLERMERVMFKALDNMSAPAAASVLQREEPVHVDSEQRELDEQRGDEGQGERLCGARRYTRASAHVCGKTSGTNIVPGETTSQVEAPRALPTLLGRHNDSSENCKENNAPLPLQANNGLHVCTKTIHGIPKQQGTGHDCGPTVDAWCEGSSVDP